MRLIIISLFLGIGAFSHFVAVVTTMRIGQFPHRNALREYLIYWKLHCRP